MAENALSSDQIRSLLLLLSAYKLHEGCRRYRSARQRTCDAVCPRFRKLRVFRKSWSAQHAEIEEEISAGDFVAVPSMPSRHHGRIHWDWNAQCHRHAESVPSRETWRRVGAARLSAETKRRYARNFPRTETSRSKRRLLVLVPLHHVLPEKMFRAFWQAREWTRLS